MVLLKPNGLRGSREGSGWSPVSTRNNSLTLSTWEQLTYQLHVAQP